MSESPPTLNPSCQPPVSPDSDEGLEKLKLLDLSEVCSMQNAGRSANGDVGGDFEISRKNESVEEAEELGVSSRKETAKQGDGKGRKSEEPRKVEAGQEHRKRWMKNTLQKEALLAILSNSELLTRRMTRTSVEGLTGENGLNVNISTVLKCSSPEASEEVTEVVRVGENEEEKENQRGNYMQLLKHEVRHLKEKFEMNNRNYQVEDLMRLTVNSKNILNLEAIQKYTEYDRKVGESVYHDLECLRLSLERKIGVCSFLKVYGKMINIINDEFDSSLKKSLEERNGETGTYAIKKFSVAGDNDDIVKNAWTSIISVLGDQQEYLPDVWELAMSENIYYHL